MSSALIRQALAFVDKEESKVRGKKRRVDASRHGGIGQVPAHPYTKKSKKQTKTVLSPTDDRTAENIKKLLALSTPSEDKTVVEKIVKRAVKGKPLVDKIEIKVAEEKSILFPEDP